MKKTITTLIITLLILVLSPSKSSANTSCTSIGDDITCASTPGCTWNSGCTTSCSSISDPTECGYSTGCNWRATTSTCSGKAQPPEYSDTTSNTYQGSGPFSDNAQDLNAEGIKLDQNLWTINGIIETFLPIIMTLGGLVLFGMLIMGGFTMMTGVGNPKAAESGKQQITSAIIGFFTLFASYWIIQILEIILGISILGS